MEKNELSLHRSRSIQAVLSDGYHLYARHFWCLVRSSWLQAVIYALAFALLMASFFTHLLPRAMGHLSIGSELTVSIGTLLLFLLAAILLAGAGAVAPLKQHSESDTISGPLRWWGNWPLKLTMQSMVRLPRMLWTVMRHHTGAFISVCLVMLLVVLIATVLFMLPAVVMAIANIEAATGTAAGDAVEMPDNLFWMNFATFGICGLLQAYIHLSTLFPLYYLWGNEKMKKEK